MARYSVDYDGNLDTTDDRVSYGSFDAATSAIGDRGFGSYGVQDNRRGGGGNLGSFNVGSDDGFAALNNARPVGNGLLGGFFNPGRMIGSGIGTMIAGPIGGLLGGLIGGGGMRGWGYEDPQGNRVSAFRDMFDGGGRGTFGDTFQGGLLSGVANNMGIRPAGYRARQAAGLGQPEAGSQGGAGTSVYSSPAPSSVQPLPPAPAVETLPTLYDPIDIAGPVRDIPAPMPSVPPIGSMPSATQRYIDMYGVPQPAPSAPARPAPAAPVSGLLPYQAPPISDLEAFIRSQPVGPLRGGYNAPGSNANVRPDTGVVRPMPSAVNAMMFQNPNPMGLPSQQTRLPYNPRGRLAPMSASGGYFGVYPEPF